MLYDIYERRIIKLSRVLNFVRQHARVLLIAVGVVVLTTASLLATKGITGKTTCPDTLAYGDTLTCDANSFLGRVYFEYKGTDGIWTQDAPRFPGNYSVRGVGTSIGGKPRYGAEAHFTILPRQTDVQVSDGSVVYGELPSVSASLPYGDTVHCSTVVYEDILKTSTAVAPDLASVRILSQDGEDVTYAYELHAVSTTISITQRPLSVTVENASQIYNGQKFSYDKYEISQGTLAPNDVLQATFDKWLIDVGEVLNTPSLRVINDKGQDITHHYRIEEQVGNLTVEKRPLLISTESQTLTYDGNAHTYGGFIVSADTPMLPDHHVEILAAGTFTDAGVYENILTFRVLDSKGNDLTDNYAIFVTYGTIEILKREATVNTHEDTWIYDGEPHAQSNATVLGLVEGHRYEVQTVTSITDAGTAENVLTLRILNGNQDVSHNYNLKYTYGTLTVTPRPIRVVIVDESKIYDGMPLTSTNVTVEAIPPLTFALVTGHHVTDVVGDATQTDTGTCKSNLVSCRVLDGTRDVTQNYEITPVAGLITVVPRPIRVVITDVTKVYDGTPLTSTDFTVEAIPPLTFALVAEHRITDVVTDGTQTDAGSCENDLVSCRVFDGERDVTHNYEIIPVAGLITVDPRPIQIVITDATKVYDGTPLTSTDFTVEAIPPLTFALVEGHCVTDMVTDGTQTDAGSSENNFVSCRVLAGARDVTYNYDFQPVAGTLTVTPRPITVSSGSAEKIYDGTPLTCPDPIRLTAGTLVLDHYLDMKATGTLTEVGTVPNTIEGTVRSGDGRDVEKNYQITYDMGTLKVLPRSIILVTTGSARAPYTGDPLTCETVSYTLLDGELREGDRITLRATGSQTEIGRSPNTFDITITDDKGEDASRFYEIQKELGTLEVYDPEADDDSDDSFGGNLDESGGLKGSISGDGGGNGDQAVILQVRSDHTGNVYFRLKSFGDFIGQGFDEATPYHLLLDGCYSYNYLTGIALQNTGAPCATMDIHSFTEQYLLPYYLGLGRADYDLQLSDVYYEGTGMTQYSLQYYIYDGTGEEIQGKLAAYHKAELAYRTYVHEHYLAIDEATRAAMNQIIAEEGFSRKDPDVIRRVAQYIQQVATYKKDYNVSIDNAENAVLAFLEYKEGVCRQFAATGTMLFRALGIPARYTIGYVGQTEAGEWVDVTAETGHAWVEIYIDGVGWIPVEVTGGGPGGNGGGGGGGGGETPDPEKTVIEITPTYQSKPYDGTPLFAQNEIDIDTNLQALLGQNYTFEVTVTGQQTEIGRGESKIVGFTLYDADGNDVTELFDIVCKPGTLEVFQPEIKVIKVYLYQLQKYYDGKPLAFENEDYEILEIAEGLELKLTLNISLTEVGYLTLGEINENISRYATYQVFLRGEDVTALCRVIFDVTESTPDSYVPIKIDPRPLELTAKSAEKMYDGKELSSPGLIVSMGTLLPEHHIDQYVIFGNLTDVGEEECFIASDSVVILDRNGNDVTNNYDIVTKPGKLTVLSSEG